MKAVCSFLFFTLGVISVVLFQLNSYLPIGMSVAIYAGISLYLLQQYKQKTVGVLMLLLWLVYILPFIHIPPYLWFDFGKEAPEKLWGLAVNPYMVDEKIITLTAMIGAVGGLGFAMGVALKGSRIERGVEQQTRRETLSIVAWLIWVVTGVVLSYLDAPQETLFTANYTTSESLLRNANFSSAGMISYALLTFAFCDALVDQSPTSKAFKRRIIVYALAFVVVFLQLIRGNRESLSLVFGVLLIYYYWAAPLLSKGQKKIPWLKISIGIFAIVGISMIVGGTRASLTGVKNSRDFVDVLSDLKKADIISFSNLLSGTWSGALLTPLSVAGDYINGFLPIKNGKDYLDLALSFPPGFITDAVGYTRPINSFAGPAWEMRYGGGGTHATVLPFRNFLMLGVFLIPAFWAYLFTGLEKEAMKKINVINLAMLGMVVMASPHWMWYGEKNIINAMIIWGLLGFEYRLCCPLKAHGRQAGKISQEKKTTKMPQQK